MTHLGSLSAIVWGGVAFVAACGSGSGPVLPEDDGTRITGASSVSASSISSSGSATTTSTSGGGGAAVTSSSVGVGGAGGAGGDCIDIGLGEPNEAEGSAFSLANGPIEDCDGDGGMITGVIGPGDADWFTYQGDDTAFCTVDPERNFSAADPLRLCKFIRCVDANANTEFDCPNGTTSATSPQGRDGCCGTSGFHIDDVNCTGTLDENTEVFIRVDRPSGTGCTSYSLSYHY